MRKVLIGLAVVVTWAGFSLWQARSAVSRSASERGAELAESVGASFDSGSIGVSVFPPGFDVRGIEIYRSTGGRRERSERGETQREVFVEIPHLQITPQIGPLLAGRLVVQRVDVFNPKLRAGRPLDSAGLRAASGPVVGFVAGGQGFPVTFHNAMVSMAPLAPGAEDTEVEFDLTAGARAAGDPIAFELKSEALGSGSSAVANGSMTPASDGTMAPEIALTFRVENALPEAFARVFQLFEGVPLADRIDMEGSIRGPIGDLGNESAPAEPLEIDATGTVGFEFASRKELLSFDAETRLYPRQLRINRGGLKWGPVPFELTGYIDPTGDRKMNLRLTTEGADVESTLSYLGVPERWRAEATIDSTLRIAGSMAKVLQRHETVMPEFVFDGLLPLVSLRATGLNCQGSVLAINAELSVSCQGKELIAGDARIPEPVFAVTYWKDEVRFVERKQALWDGSGDLYVLYRLETETGDGGGYLDDLDAAQFAANVVPGAGLHVKGRMDSIYELGYDESRGPWVIGRIGLHRGEISGTGLIRAVLTSVLDTIGKPEALEDLVAAYPSAMAGKTTEFGRFAFDFETRKDAVAVRSLAANLSGAKLEAEGIIGFDRTVALSGNLIIGPELTAALTDLDPALGALVDSGGQVRIPLQILGKTDGPIVDVGDALGYALNASRAGLGVGPFLPPGPELQIETELPKLKEYFFR